MTNSNLPTTIKKLVSLLTKSERQSAAILMGMILIMAFLDVLGVASILPFIAVLTNPELIYENSWLNEAFKSSGRLGVNSIDQFLFVLGVLVFLLLVISLAFKAATTYVQTRFALMREFSIGKRLVEGYLQQPYNWFLKRHSADLGKTVLSEVSAVIGNGLTPMMNLVAQSTVTIALLSLLMVVDPLLAFSVGTTLGLAYVSIFAMMSGWLNYLGQTRIDANRDRFTAITEAFGAAKEVKVGGLEQIFIQRFSKPAEIFARGQATAQVIAQLPRFALEAIAFGGMMLVVLYLMAKSGSFADALPIIALYAFAGYRLMPALQQIYASLTLLRFAGPAVDSLLNDLNSLEAVPKPQTSIIPMSLHQSIQLEKVSFRYPETKHATLKNVDLVIPAQTMVGFVGTTGSGKTTLADVILGLIEPHMGILRVDGQPIISENRRQWQKAIGYVPQQIYLSDDSIAANVAFGVSYQDIDQTAVENAAKIAKLHDFVITNLAEGYSTKVGERGIRLSGGQRQRIGIARALYHNPKLLILDEATSALDTLTEQAVMAAINKIGKNITTILIAHRLSTVRQCDQIFLFEEGRILASGNYSQLVNNSQKFAAMTGEKL